MTDEQKTAWHEIATRTLSNIDLDDHSQEAFLLLGASMAILGDKLPADDVKPFIETVVAVPSPHDVLYYAQDELRSADEYHGMGLGDIARDELRHAQHWIEELRKTARSQDEQRTVKDLQLRHDVVVQALPKEVGGRLDDFSVILSRYDDTRSAADREAMRATLKQQLSEIERELVEMRHEVHDPECVQMFVEFRENLRLKL